MKNVVSIELTEDPKDLACRQSDYVRFNCRECGQPTEIKKYYLMKHSKYGYICHFCKSKVYMKTVLEKREATWQNKYGCKNPSQNKDVHAKQIESLSKIDKIEKEQRRRETCQEKYGVSNPMKLKSTLDKRVETWKEKYGVENVAQLDENKIKTREKGRTIWTYLYNGLYFDSSWELQFYRYLEDNCKDFQYKPQPLKYEDGDKHRLYFPDFLVEGTYIEIKGDHLIKDGKLTVPEYFHDDGKLKQKYESKQKCMDFYEVKILSLKGLKPIIEENNSKYGKNWVIKYRWSGKNVK